MKKISPLVIGVLWVLFAACLTMAEGTDRHVWAFQGNVAFYEKNGKVGLINQEGKILAQAIYDGVDGFVDGLARVCSGDRIGMINREGKLVVPLTKCTYMDFMKGRSSVEDHDVDKVISYYDKNRGRRGIFTMDGRLVGEWDETYPFVQGAAFVRENDQWKLIDIEGNALSEMSWDAVNRLSPKGGGRVWKGDKLYEVDARGRIRRVEGKNDAGEWKLEALYRENGEEIDFSPWEDMSPFFGDIQAVKKDGKWGVVDGRGHVIQEPNWDSISEVLMEAGTRWPDRPIGTALYDVVNEEIGGSKFLCGWLNQDGTVRLPATRYGLTSRITDNRFYASKKENEEWKSYIINANGDIVIEIPEQFGFGSTVEEEFIRYWAMEGDVNQIWGFIDMDGNTLSTISFDEYTYDRFEEFSDKMREGMLPVKKLDQNGEVVELGYMDPYGRFLGSPDWLKRAEFSEGLAFVQLKEGTTAIDKNGEYAFEPQNWVPTFNFSRDSEGQLTAVVKRSEKNEYAYINEKGELLCGFHRAEYFRNSLDTLQQLMQWSYVYEGGEF
ncbi:MAG: WG repeat-containing protein [Firmicutes bacterium]|nr:WG repeat-containing protein [Bacillota bacterium]